MVAVIGDDKLLRILSQGDVTANEIYYHSYDVKHCLQDFHYHYSKRQKQINSHNDQQPEIDWNKMSALNKVFFHMCDVEQREPKSVFVVKEMEDLYIDLLQCHNIHIQSHVYRFADLLLSRSEELEKPNIGKKKL